MTQPWKEPMPAAQFERMRDILSAPSPIGLEGAMTYGVLKPMFESFMPSHWKIHQFRSNAGIVVDTAPEKQDALTVMVIGHADKIRMQVRSIGDDGKIWIDSDSFLPQTLIGHEVVVFSECQETPGNYRQLHGATVEALGAIHFADAPTRSGERGIKANQLYLETHVHGENRKAQIEALGIRSGDSVLLNRPIKPGVFPDTFYGAYLDNGLGCFVAEELARLVATDELKNLRVLFAFAAWEEIGRFGSRVFAGEMKPDVVIAVDVNHDFQAAPGIGDRRFNPLAMTKGFTLSVGAIASEFLNTRIVSAANALGIPYQRSVAGRDTGTDAMAGVLASVDAAATSIGFPIRNMHTISESAHTSDVLASIYGIHAFLQQADADGLTAEDFRNNHPRLDVASPLAATRPSKDDSDSGSTDDTPDA